jgi:hypothetical protein
MLNTITRQRSNATYKKLLNYKLFCLLTFLLFFQILAQVNRNCNSCLSNVIFVYLSSLDCNTYIVDGVFSIDLNTKKYTFFTNYSTAEQSFSNLEVFNEFTEVMLLWSLKHYRSRCQLWVEENQFGRVFPPYEGTRVGSEILTCTF